MLHKVLKSYIFGSVVKNSTSIKAALAPLFVACMLLMVSCQKEECIAPAPLDETGSTKGLPGSVIVDPPAEGNSRDGDTPIVITTGDGDGIGDDGDDLSDTERNRKKR